MSIQSVLLPVFVLIGLTFALLLTIAGFLLTVRAALFLPELRGRLRNAMGRCRPRHPWRDQ